jgi:histone arginine demethylase JMJD6
LIVGRKRWVLFPPHVPKSVVKGSGLVRDDEDDEAIHYFSFILPRIKRKASLMKGMPKYKDFCCYEFTQNPGETVYVPNGWWHAVVNVTDTIAVTQNFCSPRNFDKVWVKTRSGRKRMAWKWLIALETQYPDLAARAKAMNERDNFKMKYDPIEIKKRERAEEERRAERKRRKNEADKQGKQDDATDQTSASSDFSGDGKTENDDRSESDADSTSSSSSSSSSNSSSSSGTESSESTEESKPKRSRTSSPRPTAETTS